MNSDLAFYYLTSNFIVIILLLIYIQFDNDCYSEKRDFFALIISAVLGGGGWCDGRTSSLLSYNGTQRLV